MELCQRYVLFTKSKIKKWILFFKNVFSYLVTVEDTGKNVNLDLSMSQNLTNDLFKKLSFDKGFFYDTFGHGDFI